MGQTLERTGTGYRMGFPSLGKTKAKPRTKRMAKRKRKWAYYIEDNGGRNDK